MPLQKHIQNFLNPVNTQLSLFPNGTTMTEINQLITCYGIDPNFKDGVLLKDTGYSKLGDTLQLGKKITGLHQFKKTYTDTKLLATINDSTDTNLVLKYLNGTTWTTINTGTTLNGYEDTLVEMEDFLGSCFFAGYDATDDVFLPAAVYDGTTFSTAGMATGMPQGKYIKRYRDRLYVANSFYSATKYPYRIYYSNVVTGGSITWSSTNFIDLDFAEGITGIFTAWDKLLAWTDNLTYYYDQNVLKVFYNKGCSNHRSIQGTNRYVIWLSSDNVYLSSSIGDDPKPIGNAILQLIRNSDKSNPTVGSAALIDDEYHIFLGNTMANGVNYANCLATFNVRTLSWRWRSTYDTPTILTKYKVNGIESVYFGITGGMVMRKGKQTDVPLVASDAGQPIVQIFETLAYDYDNPSGKKTIYRITTYSEKPNGMHLQIRPINYSSEIENDWIDLGAITSIVQDFDMENILGKKLECEFLQIRGIEMSQNQTGAFNGYSVIYDITSPNQ